MNGLEIISYLSNNLPIINSLVSAVTGSIITCIFLRHNTAVKEFEKIKAGKFNEVIDDLLSSGKMTYTEYYKAKNFLNIAKLADNYYLEKLNKNNQIKLYDFDWFIRFYENSGNISNEEMQELWAKILAGEINKPSTYSLRTIEILKNLTSKEANVLKKITAHSIRQGNQWFLPNYKNYLENCNIHYIDILKLSECGLINSDANLVIAKKISKEKTILFHNNNLIIAGDAANDTIKQIDIKEFVFTEVGNELSSLMDLDTNDQDIISFAKELCINKNIKIGVYQILKREGDLVEFDIDLNLLS